jgi:membrane-associated phospholipid phosphatase
VHIRQAAHFAVHWRKIPVLSNSAPRRPALPPGSRRPLAAIALACSAGVVVIGVLVSGSSTPNTADRQILAVVERLLPAVGPGAYRVDFAGEPIGALTLMAILSVLCLVAGRWRLAALTIAGQGLIGGATNLIKPVVDRTIHGGFLAYPSGHTAGATAFAIVAGLLLVSVLQLGRWTGVLVVTGIAAAVGGVAAWAQMVLVAHYPTDTVGGFLMALALIPAAAALIDLLADRIPTVSRSSLRR